MNKLELATGRLQRVLRVRDALASYAAGLNGGSEEARLVSKLDRLLGSTDLRNLADRLWGRRGVENRPSAFGDKYLDFGPRLVQNLERARRVGLAIGRGQSVLDLGAGTGMFCWVANQLGHHAVALQPE